MTVIFKTLTESFTGADIAWNRPGVARAVARHILLNHTETYIDLIVDCPEEMGTTRDEMQAALAGVQANAEDMANDLLDEFVTAVKEELKAALYGAIVTGIKYDLAGGLKDIEVDVSVNWE